MDYLFGRIHPVLTVNDNVNDKCSELDKCMLFGCTKRDNMYLVLNLESRLGRISGFDEARDVGQDENI